LDDLRPTLALARKIARNTKPEKIMVILSKTGRSEKQIQLASMKIEESGFPLLEALWPQRDGYITEFDYGRAGSEAINPHLRRSALAVENALLAKIF